MKATDMNILISQLNGCLTWTGFGVIGLDRVATARVLEKWFDWYIRAKQAEKNKLLSK